ncbi:putative gp14 [Enterobacteriaceae bacterium ATCC 29904]|nr:putative gp14 [Enterobacteriaceae bacterium ATCC 29904]
MPVKGIKRVQMNTRRVLSDIAGIRTEKVLYLVMNAGANHAALITPVKSSTLINSQYKKLEPMPSGMMGRVGYTANYAAAVNAAKGKLKGKPRLGGSGNYWDPNGEPGFLRKGFERDGLNEIKAIIRQGYKV